MGNGLRGDFATDSGMWVLWDASSFSGVSGYESWERELLAEKDILRHVAAGHLVPVNIRSDGCCGFEVRVGEPGSPARLTGREAGAAIENSQPFMLVTSGRLRLSGIEHVCRDAGAEAGGLSVEPSKYAVTAHLLDRDKEKGLPDFVLLVNPAPADLRPVVTLETFLRKGVAPSNPRLSDALESFAAEDSDEAVEEVLAAVQDATFLLCARKLPEGVGDSPAALPAGVDIALLGATGEDGRNMLLLFTDLETLRERSPDSAWIALGSEAALRIVLEKGYDGAVINPAGRFFVLEREIVAGLLNG